MKLSPLLLIGAAVIVYLVLRPKTVAGTDAGSVGVRNSIGGIVQAQSGQASADVGAWGPGQGL